jgi:predicted PurR-regulated permease PerM
VVFGAVTLFVSWVTPHVTDAVRQAPSHLPADSGQAFTVLQRWLRLPGVSPSMVERAIAAAASAVDAGARRMTTAFMRVATYLPWLVLIPILSFFLLKDAEALTDAAIRLLPRRWQQGAPALLDRVDTALAAYIRAQLLACTIVGVIVGVGFTLLRVPLAAVFGVAAGVAEFVPLLGPLVIAVVAAVVSAVRHPMAAIWVLLFLGVLRVTEDYFIYPRLVGSSVHLHPLAVILAVLAGGELGGVVGVLLSVPILAAAAAVYECVGDARRATT